MTAHRKVQFLVADGSRARWITRGHDNGAFVTDRVTHPTNADEGHGPGRHGTADHSDAGHRHAAAFADELSAALNREAGKHAWESLVIVAPPRMLNEIQRALNADARPRLHASLGKDLTKVADHDLGEWLQKLELIALAAEHTPAA